MRPFLFLLPTLAVVVLAVACQPAGRDAAAQRPVPPAPADAGDVAAQARAPAVQGGAVAPTTVVFRADGRAPGWTAQVVGEASPALRVEIEGGQARYDVDTLTQGPDGWAGTATDGTPVKLSVQRVICDSVQSPPLPVKVMLTLGTRQLHGCGRPLPAG